MIIRAVDVGSAGGPEAAARDARYAAIEDVATELDAVAVLLGHTRDDQAESVLLRLARGSGARSISGMASRRGRLRPAALRREGLPRDRGRPGPGRCAATGPAGCGGAALDAPRAQPEAYPADSYAYSDSTCLQEREYQTTVVVGGKNVPAYGTACLQPDGSWKRDRAQLVSY